MESDHVLTRQSRQAYVNVWHATGRSSLERAKDLWAIAARLIVRATGQCYTRGDWTRVAVQVSRVQ
jgi:hypothetical protein